MLKRSIFLASVLTIVLSPSVHAETSAYQACLDRAAAAMQVAIEGGTPPAQAKPNWVKAVNRCYLIRLNAIVPQSDRRVPPTVDRRRAAFEPDPSAGHPNCSPYQCAGTGTR